MFQIDDKYSGKDKKNTIGYLKERERQKLRKKQHPISRELDNNYQVKLHKRSWWPNGTFIRKKIYYFADPGLGYFYEKNNVEQLKDLREIKKELSKKKLKEFIEYRYIDENQYAITIEYCSNCEEHKTHTFHRAELYKNYAISLQKCILLRFPFIKVILKPIDTDILKEEKYKLPEVDTKGIYEQRYVNDKFKDVRIGAFEVQMCFKKIGEEQKTALLHSKLQTKQFPVIMKILDKIVSYLPTFTGKIITYEKEEDKNMNLENNKENFEELYKKGLLEGLQINVYLLNNNKILKIANEAWNDIQTQNDPHKRQIMMKEMRIRQKENMFKNKNESDFEKINKSNIRTLKSKRPMTGFGKYHKSQSMTNLLRPNSSKSDFNLDNNFSNNNISNFNKISRFDDSIIFKRGVSPMNNYILDKDKAKTLKGKLILSKYTNSEGIIDIGPLPYDSYYIEVQESKQYRSVGLCLTFNTLNLKNKNYIKKYIGLFTQENSFIQLHVYEVNKDKNGSDDPIHLPKSKVTLKKLANQDENQNFNNNNSINNNFMKEEQNIEKKIELNEKANTPGIFEHTVPPGRYLLEVEKLNYETIRKFIDLEKGANSINVEMSIERCSNLHIFVYNYEKFQEELYIPINNVDVIIYQNSNEILEESITDKKGEVNYIVNKGEDFLTIVVNKFGYYPVQRTYIRNKDSPVNEKGEYEESLIFFLVKESFIIENNCILCVTYSNLSEVNFDPNGIQISDKIKNKLNLSCFDGQKENGIISTFIKYQNNQENTQNQYMENIENENVNDDNNNDNIQGNNLDANDNVENNNNNNENIPEQNNNMDNDKNGNNNENNQNNENIQDNMTSNENNNGSEETENYDNIISLSFLIQTEALKNSNVQDKGFAMNGLERYGCQTIIYMPKNMFYVTSPSFSQEGYYLWNLGWIDVKNQLFYQSNTLTNNLEERTLYFSQWLEFLQSIIDNQIYSKLFEFFNFDKAILHNNDRYINENLLIQSLKKLDFCKENEDEIFSFIISLFKSGNNMISFSLLKKKISSNLKNFADGFVGGRQNGDNNISVTISENKDININDINENEFIEGNENNEFNNF